MIRDMKFNYKFINDPIYGGIGLSKLEVEIINLPIFQRLRSLKQLALVSYVFPGAEHSRFSHSIGVLHIMGKMCEHLRICGDLDDDEVIKLRIAALLHDIGHYPLSHLGEDVFKYSMNKRNSSIKAVKPQILNRQGEKVDPDESKSLLSLFSEKISRNDAHHERIGRYIIENHKGINDILRRENIDPVEISDIITGEITPETPMIVNDKKYIEIYKKRYKLTQLMHSSLDADRLDYLIRDSTLTGVKYGIVDLDYLIRLIRVKKFKIQANNDKLLMDVIACNKKGQHVVEHYLMSRYFHYSQVVNHKTSLAFESVAKVLFYKLIEKKMYIINSHEDLLAAINGEDFLNFNDITLYEYFDRYAESVDSDQVFKDFYQSIKYRKRPKILLELKEIVGKKDKTSNLKYYNIKRKMLLEHDKLANELGLNNDYFGYKEFSINVETLPRYLDINDDLSNNENDLREAIKLFEDEDNVSFLVHDETSMINKLADLTSKTFRLFTLMELSDEETQVIQTKLRNVYRVGVN